MYFWAVCFDKSSDKCSRGGEAYIALRFGFRITISESDNRGTGDADRSMDLQRKTVFTLISVRARARELI